MKIFKKVLLILALLVIAGGGYLIFHFEGKEVEPDKTVVVTDITLFASSILSEMSLEEKVGQLFWSRCPVGLKAGEGIKEFAPGGYLLLADFFVDKNIDKVRAEVSSLSKMGKIPVAFAVIEEGGKDVTASRFTNYREEPFKTSSHIFSTPLTP